MSGPLGFPRAEEDELGVVRECVDSAGNMSLGLTAGSSWEMRRNHS